MSMTTFERAQELSDAGNAALEARVREDIVLAASFGLRSHRGPMTRKVADVLAAEGFDLTWFGGTEFELRW